MGRLRLVGCLKTLFSFAKELYKRHPYSANRPIFWSILPIRATSYHTLLPHPTHLATPPPWRSSSIPALATCHVYITRWCCIWDISPVLILDLQQNVLWHVAALMFIRHIKAATCHTHQGSNMWHVAALMCLRHVGRYWYITYTTMCSNMSRIHHQVVCRVY